MFCDGRSRFRPDYRRVRHDTSIGTWERRRTALRPRCAGSVSLADAPNMPFIRHADDVSCERMMRGFLSRRFDVDKGFGWLSSCCIGRPDDRFYLTCDAVNWWHKLYFECQQRTNVKGPRFVGWHLLEVFAIASREHDALYSPVKDA